MARLQPPPEGALALGTRIWFRLFRRLFGRVLAPYRIAAHAPRVVSGLSLMNVVFGTGSWALEPGLRTLVHLRVAALIGCVF
jgi:alkylhydroperoxidase family enzyme